MSSREGSVIVIPFILPDAEHRRVLLCSGGGAWMLPHFEEASDQTWTLPHFGLHTPCRADPIDTLQDRLGLVISVFYAVDVQDPDTGSHFRVHTLENHSPDWAPPEDGRWVGREALDDLPFQRPIERAALVSWFAEADAGGKREPLVPWWRPGWFREAVAWTEAELHRRGITPSGFPKQVQSWYRSSVLRLETSTGAVHFKASPRAFAHEAALTRWLAAREPTRVPGLLAADLDRAWTLTRDAGGVPLQEVREVVAWEEVLRAYARLQIASVSRVEELVALGCLDMRVERLAEQVDAFFAEWPWLLQGSPDRLTPEEEKALRSLVPRLQEECKKASGGVPCALEHGDFHAVNVVITPNGPVFIDWGEGCITHPFFSLMSMLGDSDVVPQGADVAARLRDVYLWEWNQFDSMDRCRQHFATLRPLYLLQRAFQDRGQLAACWKQLGSRSPMPLTAAEWSIRDRQHWLADRLRALLNCYLDA